MSTGTSGKGSKSTATAEARARVKLVDVARAAGVSPTTVSHAMNGRGYVDPKTREHVKQTAARLGYRPNHHAQQLRTGEARTIVLVSSMPFAVAGGPSRLGFLMEIAAAAASIALARGLALVLAPPIEGAAAALDRLDFDGALVVEPAASDPQIAAFVARGLPVVSIGKPPVASVPFVDLRSAATTRQLLDHLRARGARRIALVTGAQRRTAYLEAVTAYEAFAARHRMTPIVKRIDEGEGEEGGRAAARELLLESPSIDAICVPVDALAAGVVQALVAQGRRVPQDVMVATRYDGIRARTSEPPLTALDLHLEAVATLAVDMLLGRLRGDAIEPRAEVRPADLVARASTAR